MANMERRGGPSTFGPGRALGDTTDHPGYSAAYSPGTNYKIGRRAGKPGREIVEQLNALYVLNKYRNPMVAESFRKSRDYASRQLRGSR